MTRLLAEFYDLGGTASRRRALAALALPVVLFGAAYGLTRGDPVLGRWLMPLVGLANVWALAVLVRRLHEAGRSGVWVLTVLLPGVGAVAALVIALLPRARAHDPGPTALRTLGVAGLGFLTLLSVLRLFWAPLFVLSEADAPTLLPGDLVALRLSGPGDYGRGAVVAFRHPVRDEVMIKRIVGLPGDTVQMRAGQLVLNGTPVPQTEAGQFAQIKAPQGPAHIVPRCTNDPVGLGGQCLTDRLTETLPDGPTHDILSVEPAGLLDDTPAFTVPQGQYFVMGDNRDNALDSRISGAAGGIGLVPATRVLGPVDVVLLSSSAATLLDPRGWRPGRILRGVE